MKNIEQEIMSQSRHKFIYSEDNVVRRDLLKGLEESYPIRVNTNDKMAIYMEEFALPRIVDLRKYQDEVILSSISRKFLIFTVIYNIIDKILRQDNLQIDNDRLNLLLKTMSRLSLNTQDLEIKSLYELLDILRESRDFYATNYIDYLCGYSNFNGKNELRIPFLEINSIIHLIKQMLNNESQFALIFDKQCDIPIISTKAINSLISMHNGNFVVRVGCEEGNWDTFTTLVGESISSPHQYDTIYLDEKREGITRKLSK